MGKMGLSECLRRALLGFVELGAAVEKEVVATTDPLVSCLSRINLHDPKGLPVGRGTH